jgi:putative nucleotidyltransferase with HDIG domain
MNRLKVNLYEFLSCLSNAQDMVMPRLSNHHHMVAYLAYKLAERANLSVDEQKNVISAALIHDIGALSIGERLELIETEPEYINDHAFKGAKLLKNFTLMSDDVARVVKYHHIPWSNGNGRFFKGGTDGSFMYWSTTF